MHRLVVVDKDDVVHGIISLSDILKFLVLSPCCKYRFLCHETKHSLIIKYLLDFLPNVYEKLQFFLFDEQCVATWPQGKTVASYANSSMFDRSARAIDFEY